MPVYCGEHPPHHIGRLVFLLLIFPPHFLTNPEMFLCPRSAVSLSLSHPDHRLKITPPSPHGWRALRPFKGVMWDCCCCYSLPGNKRFTAWRTGTFSILGHAENYFRVKVTNIKALWKPKRVFIKIYFCPTFRWTSAGVTWVSSPRETMVLLFVVSPVIQSQSHLTCRGVRRQGAVESTNFWTEAAIRSLISRRSWHGESGFRKF